MIIDFIENVLIPHISGLWTLPWILVGFIATIIIAKFTGRQRIDAIMKKIGLILLYFFVPVLIFRIFLNTTFGEPQIIFSIIVCAIILLMYVLAYIYATHLIKKIPVNKEKSRLFLKTMLTNQGRSSAFIGSMMLAISAWTVPAALYMALVGIALFAIIPYILSSMHKKESKESQTKQIKALPWFLKLYPWYLLAFVILGIGIHATTGYTTETLFGHDASVLLTLYTAITIPAALYYVGAGIHPTDLKKSELRKLIGKDKGGKDDDHWIWVRKIFLLTVLITPAVILLIFVPLFALSLIPAAWFSVIIINAVLPITSTNMFLLPYGIDKRSTAHSVTWTTLVCVPLVVALILLFSEIGFA